MNDSMSPSTLRNLNDVQGILCTTQVMNRPTMMNEACSTTGRQKWTDAP